MGKSVVFVAALVLATVLGIAATTPPAPLGADSPVTVFAAGRAMADVRVIAKAPHLAASPEDAAVRTHIALRMQALGMEVRSDAYTAKPQSAARLAWWSGKQNFAPVLTNVIGVLPGKDRSLPAVLLMAHHDTVAGSPGAADDTTGVASLLEVARAVKAGGQPARDLVVLITDGEELGLDGAGHFFTRDPLRTHIGAVINVEARGGGGRTTLFETSANNGAAIARAASSIRYPAGSSLAVFIYKVLPNDTDLTEALAGPYTAYNFAFIGRPWLYHSPKATPEAIDQGSLQDMGAEVLDLARGLLGAEPLPDDAPDAVFFDAFGFTLVAYPAWVGWVMLGLAAAGLGFAATRKADWRGLAVGAARMLTLIALAGLTLFAMNRLSLAPGAANYYDRLAAIPRLEAMALAGGLAAFLLAMGAWKPSVPAMAGAALPLLVLGVAGQVLAPTAAYVVVLPVMLAAGAIAVSAGAAGRIVGVVVAALVGGYMLALGHQVMQGVGPNLPVAAVLPLVLAALAALPLWPGLGRKAAWAVAAALLMLDAGTALWVRLDPIADTVPVYSADK